MLGDVVNPLPTLGARQDPPTVNAAAAATGKGKAKKKNKCVWCGDSYLFYDVTWLYWCCCWILGVLFLTALPRKRRRRFPQSTTLPSFLPLPLPPLCTFSSCLFFFPRYRDFIVDKKAYTCVNRGHLVPNRTTARRPDPKYMTMYADVQLRTFR